MKTGQRATALLFVVAVVSFFVTFAYVSADGEMRLELSGRQLATGTAVEDPVTEEEVDIVRDLWAGFVFLATIVGFVCAFGTTRGEMAVPVICGLAGAAALFPLMSSVKEDAAAWVEGATVAPGVGFWLAVVFLGAAGLAGLITGLAGKDAPQPDAGPAEGTPAPPSPAESAEQPPADAPGEESAG